MVKGEDPPPAARHNHPQPSPALDEPAPNDPAVMVCPDCGGVLTERIETGVPQWQCRVGHRYSAAGLVDAQADNIESALWMAIRTLEDRARLLGSMAESAESRGMKRSARSFRARGEAANEQARAVREALTGAAETTLVKTGHDELDVLAAGGSG